MKKLLLSLLALSINLFACTRTEKPDQAMLMDSIKVVDTASVMHGEPIPPNVDMGMSMDSISPSILSDTGTFNIPSEPKK